MTSLAELMPIHIGACVNFLKQQTMTSTKISHFFVIFLLLLFVFLKDKGYKKKEKPNTHNNNCS